MYGWTGKILYINLTKKKYHIERPDIKIYEKYIGGKGLAGFYLKEFITEPWDSENMPILFFTGPLVNTMSPTSGLSTIMSKSPLTGTVGHASVGGKLGQQIKRAGYDGIIITGKSDNYTGINILNNKIEFKDADYLKGKKTNQVSELLKTDGSLAVIGPAAENGVLFANIIIDEYYAAGQPK